MALLLLKLTITPAVIALATLVARRYGPAVGGWLIGLPLTNGPVALFLTLEHGPAFTAHVAKGFVAGISGEVAFVLSYFAVVRRGRGWASAGALASLAYVVSGLALDAATRSVAFASTLILALSRLPVAAAFCLAAVLTLSIQLGSFRAVRRAGVAA